MGVSENISGQMFTVVKWGLISVQSTDLVRTHLKSDVVDQLQTNFNIFT